MLEYYVINLDHNANEAKLFNIFSNWVLEEAVIEEIKLFLENPQKYSTSDRDGTILYGFQAFVYQLDSCIKWQEWSRYEYEIGVVGKFAENVDNLVAFDCYDQCKKNMRAIATEVLTQYREKKDTN